MALPPKNVITPPPPPPPNGGKIRKLEYVKAYSIWAVAFLFAIELSSFFLWDSDDYQNFYYPILNQLAFIVLLFNIYAWRKKLYFCKFKEFSIFCLIAYYLSGIIAIIFHLDIFIQYIQYFFLTASALLFIFSWKRFTTN